MPRIGEWQAAIPKSCFGIVPGSTGLVTSYSRWKCFFYVVPPVGLFLTTFYSLYFSKNYTLIVTYTIKISVDIILNYHCRHFIGYKLAVFSSASFMGNNGLCPQVCTTSNLNQTLQYFLSVFTVCEVRSIQATLHWELQNLKQMTYQCATVLPCIENIH